MPADAAERRGLAGWLTALLLLASCAAPASGERFQVWEAQKFG